MPKKIIQQISHQIMYGFFITLISATQLWAKQDTGDPVDVSQEFSEKIIDIVQGPVLKVLAAAVLLVGVAGLLRGKHKLAVSCGVAFLLLLFLPLLLEKV